MMDTTPDNTSPDIAAGNPLENALFKGLNTAVDKALALDPKARKNLRALTGKVIEVRLQPFNISLFMLPDNEGFRLQSRHSGPVDTTIEGTPLALFAMGADTPVSGLTPVRIAGDASLGQHMAKWLKTLNPDWEEGLCQLLGDGPGVRVAKTLRAGGDFARRLATTLIRSGSEYLTEESRMVVTAAELEPFYDAVDDLKAETQRLERRLQQLRQQLNSNDA